MNILNVEKVSKTYGEKELFNNISLGINSGDKIGLIGVNGTGKSTLLKIIAGVEEPDEGQVVKGRGIELAYLAQTPLYYDNENVLEYVMRGKHADSQPKAKEILNKLGITNHGAMMNILSGGQKKRAALARTLVEPARLLILDEPTNHLDNDMVLWLEQFIKNFKGELIMVTHDRYFLDNVTNRIVELDKASMYSYDTNYSGFLELKTQREEMERATEAKRQNILRKELAWIRRGCQARSTKQQARIDRFEDMKEASKQARARFDKQLMDMNSVSSRLGRKTVELHNICKSFGERTIIDDFTYIFLRDDRIGIVGDNGCGKSTLMKIIAGQLEPDSGSVEVGETVRIGYFMQENEPLDDSLTVLEFVRSIGEYVTTADGKATASQMCEKFLFTPKQQWTPISKLSGGEKRRLYLLSVLMSAPNVLILDEPTNDLDIETLEILEEYLDGFAGIVITVSHDRYFLDRVTNKILEISHGGLYAYEANYSKFLELKAEREEMELASERKRQSVLRMELEWAKRGCRARSTKQRARLERLEALKNGKAPVRDANVELDSVETRMGKKTIELHHISKSFGEKKILDDFNYIVLRNQRLGIIGPNGCGKSTLIKIIDGMIQPDAGEVEIGETIRIGYFAQEVPDMDTNQRVIDYIRDVAEYIPTRDGKISATMMLERFLFDSAMQYAPIAKLSGGEKRRLYLLKVLMEAPNVLLLDEPSNDLDIPTLTILEDYLDSFAGIVIAVSHDRYFLDNIVDRIFAFEGNGHLTQYEGGYTDYTEALARKGGAVSEGQSTAVGAEKKKSAQADWKQNRPQKLKFTYKEQREFETIDDDIAALEELLEKLDKDMEANATNSVKLREIMEQKEKAQADLDEKMDRWVYLNDLAERIEAQKSEK